MIIDGKAIASQKYDQLKQEVANLSSVPKLSIIIVGNDPGSEMYVKMKSKKAEELGIDSEIFAFTEDASDNEIIDCIKKQNNDKNVAGILVQLPLPNNHDKQILETIDPKKDVDCLTSVNMGLLSLNNPRFYPATVKAVLTAIEATNTDLKGKVVTVIGQSDMVGMPAAIAAIIKDATVISCNSKTPNLKEFTIKSDIIVSAVGKPHLVTKDMVKNGVIIIDCGIIKKDGIVLGDVNSDVSELASAITPVPGGIGPLTILSLLENTVQVASQ